jgi:outer membrane protein
LADQLEMETGGFMKFGTLLIAFLAVGIMGAAESPEVKIGFIDMQKAIQTTSAGKKAKATLETEFNKKKKELESKEEALKKMGEDLQKKNLVLSDEVKAKKQQDFQQEMMKYRELVGKSQEEIQKKERDLTAPIIKKLQEIIADVARKDNYTMILEKSEQAVLWAKKDIDLTDRLVKEFENKK